MEDLPDDKTPKKIRNVVEIPISAIRKSQAMSQRSSCRSSASCRRFNVAELSQDVCPYNKNHVIQASKMESHLEQCRREYKKGLLESGKERHVLSCKYNHTHQVEYPELQHHEARCLDRFVIPSYLLYLNPYFEAVGEVVEENLEDVEIPDEELEKLYAGFYIDKYVGSELPTFEPVPVEKLDIPLEELLTLKEVKDVELSMAARSQTGKGSQEQDDLQQPGTSKQTFRDAHGKGWKCSTEAESTFQTGDYTEEELKEWRGDPKNPQPKFDYMQSTYNPQKPMLKYPPGLTKAARRNFVEWNTKWMKDILKKGENAQPEIEPETPKIPAEVAVAETFTFSDDDFGIDSDCFHSSSDDNATEHEYTTTSSEPSSDN